MLRMHYIYPKIYKGSKVKSQSFTFCYFCLKNYFFILVLVVAAWGRLFLMEIFVKFFLILKTFFVDKLIIFFLKSKNEDKKNADLNKILPVCTFLSNCNAYLVLVFI